MSQWVYIPLVLCTTYVSIKVTFYIYNLTLWYTLALGHKEVSNNHTKLISHYTLTSTVDRLNIFLRIIEKKKKEFKKFTYVSILNSLPNDRVLMGPFQNINAKYIYYLLSTSSRECIVWRSINGDKIKIYPISDFTLKKPYNALRKKYLVK